MPSESVDLIYLDPPFNSKKYYNLPFKKLGRDGKAVEAFKDIWTWDEETKKLYEELTANRKYTESIKQSRPPPPPLDFRRFWRK